MENSCTCCCADIRGILLIERNTGLGFEISPICRCKTSPLFCSVSVSRFPLSIFKLQDFSRTNYAAPLAADSTDIALLAFFCLIPLVPLLLVSPVVWVRFLPCTSPEQAYRDQLGDNPRQDHRASAPVSDPHPPLVQPKIRIRTKLRTNRAVLISWHFLHKSPDITQREMPETCGQIPIAQFYVCSLRNKGIRPLFSDGVHNQFKAGGAMDKYHQAASSLSPPT